MLEFCAGSRCSQTVIPSAWADLAFNDSRSHRSTKSKRMILLRNNRIFLCQNERQLLWNDTLCVNRARLRPFIARANTLNPRNSRRICVFSEYRSPKQTTSKPFSMISLQIGKIKCPGMIFLQKKWGEGVFARKSSSAKRLPTGCAFRGQQSHQELSRVNKVRRTFRAKRT